MARKIAVLQIILYFISPFLSLELAKMTSAVDFLFMAMFIMITVSQWLAINSLGKLVDK